MACVTVNLGMFLILLYTLFNATAVLIKVGISVMEIVCCAILYQFRDQSHNWDAQNAVQNKDFYMLQRKTNAFYVPLCQTLLEQQLI